MRLKDVILGTSSLAALALAGTPAFAQSGTPAAPPVATGGQTGTPVANAPPAQTSATDTSTTADQDADTVTADAAVTEGDIVVTGFRQSLTSSRNIKRNAAQVIDSVVAEDIGKLPDIAVSDTAARLPGIQVIRSGGEASNVLVRGLDERYFNTLFNGREIFTAERRQVALQDFPSAGIAALEVFKTSTANLVEAGLAGLVNVRSRRPFDFTEPQISGTVWGLLTKQAGKVSPNGNLLITDRFDTGIGEIGLLVNGSVTEIQYLDSEPSNTDFLATPSPTLRFPDIQRLFYRSGQRVRPSINAAIQWRPSPSLEFYGEALWQGFRNKIDDRLLEVPLYGATYSNLVYRNGSTNLLRSGTATNPGNRLFTFQGATYNKTDTFQFAVGAIYEKGPFKLTADVARTRSIFTGSTESLDRVFNGPYSVDFDLDTPQFAIRGIDLADPAITTFQGLFEQNQRSSGKDVQARVDATYSFDDFFVRNIQFGARYTDRSALRQFGERFGFAGGANRPATQLPGVVFAPINSGFNGTTVQSNTRSFFSPTYDSIRQNIVAIRNFTTANGGGLTADPPVALTQFNGSENTLAGYAQVNFGIGETFDGTVGIRANRTRTRVVGLTPGLLRGDQGDEVEFLPNASARLRITPELQLRLSATQTITRPVFGDLNPASSLGAPVGNPITDPAQIAANPFINARRGDAGNPFLQPLRSNNFDAGLEYYFSPTGFAAVTVFRRDLKGFVFRSESRFVDPVLGPLIITAPFNSGTGRIDGLEAQLQTFFDFDFIPEFARGFGIQANYTLLDAKTDYQDAPNLFVRDRITGVSKWTYNLVGLYERGPFSSRLTYNRRGPTLEQRQIRGTSDFYQEFARFPARIDLSANLAFRPNATLFFDWTNITGKPFSQSISSARDGAPRAEYARFLRFEETTFSVGLRFRIGGAPN